MIEPLAPELAVELDGFLGRAQRLGIEGAAVDAALAGAPKEPGLLEHLDVLRHGGERHAEGLRELRDRARLLADHPQDIAAGGVGEGVEDEVELGGLKVNHMVEY